MLVWAHLEIHLFGSDVFFSISEIFFFANSLNQFSYRLSLFLSVERPIVYFLWTSHCVRSHKYNKPSQFLLHLLYGLRFSCEFFTLSRAIISRTCVHTCVSHYYRMKICGKCTIFIYRNHIYLRCYACMLRALRACVACVRACVRCVRGD